MKNIEYIIGKDDFLLELIVYNFANKLELVKLGKFSLKIEQD